MFIGIAPVWVIRRRCGIGVVGVIGRRRGIRVIGRRRGVRIVRFLLLRVGVIRGRRGIGVGCRLRLIRVI